MKITFEIYINGHPQQVGTLHLVPPNKSLLPFLRHSLGISEADLVGCKAVDVQNGTEFDLGKVIGELQGRMLVVKRDNETVCALRIEYV